MKYFRMTVNGKKYDVQVEEVGGSTAAAPAAAPVSAPAAPAAPAPVAAPAPAKAAPAASLTGEIIKAPMPGTIVKTLVNPGDAVKKGQVLLILEAMKMENEIQAPHDATVTAVAVRQGDSVNSGDPMVSLA